MKMTNITTAKFDLLPEFLSSRDLIKLGLYPSLAATYSARVRGCSPNFIKLKHKILYPKMGVIEFIERYMQSGEHTKDKE